MYRLLYKSTGSEKIDKQAIRDILYTSLQNNQRNKITGALLATRSHFLQALEGDYALVNETFFKIAADPRHHTIELISFGAVHRRLFDKWSMKGFGIFDLNVETENRLKEKYGQENDVLSFPQEEWLALSLVFDVSMMAEDVLETS